MTNKNNKKLKNQGQKESKKISKFADKAFDKTKEELGKILD